MFGFVFTFFIFQFLMYNEGDITRTADLVDPAGGRLSHLLQILVLLALEYTP